FWAVRAGADLGPVEAALHEAYRRGRRHVGRIAQREAPRLGLDAGFCRRYLETVITFDLGPRELAGLRHYYERACAAGLARPGRPAPPRGRGPPLRRPPPPRRHRRPVVRPQRATMKAILDKAADGQRLTPEEGLALFGCHDLAALGRAADAACRRLHPERY